MSLCLNTVLYQKSVPKYHLGNTYFMLQEQDLVLSERKITSDHNFPVTLGKLLLPFHSEQGSWIAHMFSFTHNCSLFSFNATALYNENQVLLRHLCLAGHKNIYEQFGNMNRVYTKMMHMDFWLLGRGWSKKMRGCLSFTAAESSSKNYQVNCCLLAFLSPLSVCLRVNSKHSSL